MTIEVRVLNHMITELEQGFRMKSDENFIELADWVLKQAKYMLHPLQSHIDIATEVWTLNPAWTRVQCLQYLGRQPNLWVLRSLCVGNMNFNVENDGFLGWAREGFDTFIDWEVLIEVSSRLKTPVGGNVLAVFLAVKNCLASPDFSSDDPDRMAVCVNNLDVFTQSYMSMRYEFMAQVEHMIRADVPTLYKRPLFVVV